MPIVIKELDLKKSSSGSYMILGARSRRGKKVHLRRDHGLVYSWRVCEGDDVIEPMDPSAKTAGSLKICLEDANRMARKGEIVFGAVEDYV